MYIPALSSKQNISLFWFRRDLRLEDNVGLYEALKSEHPVLPLFIFDSIILDQLENQADRRVSFIYNALRELNDSLEKLGSSLLVCQGTPQEIFMKLTVQYDIKAVYTNEDYEPYALQRDEKIKSLLFSKGISFHTYTDQVIFRPGEILKEDGTPYSVYTAFMKKWKSRLTPKHVQSYPTEKYAANFLQQAPLPFIELSDIGFDYHTGLFEKPAIKQINQRQYHQTRDIPALPDGTSHLSTHLRFGTISIRKVIELAVTTNEIWLNEFIWREFFMCILFFHPYTIQRSFKPAYDSIEWDNNELLFKKWCEGKTGYPLVDAGMRELNETGFMHNRVRMITASFLVKNLLIDWRWGEAYFASKLMDYDQAANVGNWQWVAGCGCDAAPPYFRIFNPIEQQKRFDPDFIYITKWVPEISSGNYSIPIIDLKSSRKRTLDAFAKAIK